MVKVESLRGVWSATPTPFTDAMKIDTISVKRMVEHHLRLGVKGLFLAGTCGEGPWMPERERHKLVRTVAKYAKGKLFLAVQVTDNSSARILDNVYSAKEDGADIAVIAPPYFLSNVAPEKILDLYCHAVRRSPLPVGIYDSATCGKVSVPDNVIKAIYGEKNVILVKDSSSSPERRKIALAVRKKRPELVLLDGNEFMCVDYLKAGYDGLLLGGGIFNGYLAGRIIDAVRAGDLLMAERLQRRMNRIMWAVYGGKKISCWLSGEKKLLVEMGIFRTWRNFPGYPLKESCARAIARVLEKDIDVLMPWKENKK